MSRKIGDAFHMQTWPEETTMKDVAGYATRDFSKWLILFVTAEQKQDSEQMNLAAKEMRSVVTRIDQFRRMRVRQWRVQPGLSPTSSSTPANSAT